MGEYYVLDTSRHDDASEAPVVVWIAGESQDGDGLQLVAANFGSFFWDALQQVLGPR